MILFTGCNPGLLPKNKLLCSCAICDFDDHPPDSLGRERLSNSDVGEVRNDSESVFFLYRSKCNGTDLVIIQFAISLYV